MIQRLGELWEAAPAAFWLVLAACAYFAVMAVRLTVIDVRHHLLPNRIVFPSYAVAGVLLLGAVLTLAVGDPSGVPDGGARLFGVPALRILAGLDDGKSVRFLNINHVFLGRDGRIPWTIMPDQLHLSPAGYQLWAEAIDKTRAEMME